MPRGVTYVRASSESGVKVLGEYVRAGSKFD